MIKRCSLRNVPKARTAADGTWDAWYVYIGRSAGHRESSPLANPFKISEYGHREQVITLYRKWLNDKVAYRDEAVMAELARLHSIEIQHCELHLVCWCSEHDHCHADIIINALNYLYPQTWKSL